MSENDGNMDLPPDWRDSSEEINPVKNGEEPAKKSYFWPVLIATAVLVYSFWGELKNLVMPPAPQSVEEITDPVPADEPPTASDDALGMDSLLDMAKNDSPTENQAEVSEPMAAEIVDVDQQIEMLLNEGTPFDLYETPTQRAVRLREKEYVVGKSSEEVWSDENLKDALNSLTQEAQEKQQRAKPIRLDSVVPSAKEQWVISSKKDRYALNKLANKGEPAALNALGKHALYAEGSAKAYRHIDMAAHAGHPESMYLLGRMYHKGLFIPQDAEMAYAWYTLASAFGYPSHEERIELTLELDEETLDSYQYKAEWLLSRMVEKSLNYAKQWKQKYAPDEALSFSEEPK